MGECLREEGFGRLLVIRRLHGGNCGNDWLVDNMIVLST